ncbi:MAG: GNAT family N-acetyltransferase [Eubacterium aggregans]|uniref:Ribosomal protein S18 acetylase RimI n=1 Tax=Eubacterium aggregans TaxID=81409 RepID=A0A1H3X024_9FIRM|nr:GNAT family N-acetyltransferase [Eubacterium aggregans]MDD4692085.1 GNAT family N-acetyltransferase [Eubacterium aggregans]MEA5074568.1 GNAT family N-acetyltransferase [Eubacterium aggregans]SDZ92024.1 Ribosomal protein S18 acetylase RimI [Eubacterium aggregans]
MLKTIGPEDFDAVYAIMEEAFPVSERRPYHGQRKLLEEEAYTLYGYEKGGELAAFMALWELEPFIFTEHFAVSPAFRNQGMGETILGETFKVLHKPLILEVEEPEVSEMARRRVGFYERNGFHLTEVAYDQPVLTPGGEIVPLRVMSWPEPLSVADFQAARKEFFQRVYGQKK